MAESAYINAEKIHLRVKYNLELDIKKYAPYVPDVQTLFIPPKGPYCNKDYNFCPNLLWGGFCTELYKSLQAVDGYQSTIITDAQFWDCLGEGDKPHKTTARHGVAVGSYKVYKKQCGN